MGILGTYELEKVDIHSKNESSDYLGGRAGRTFDRSAQLPRGELYRKGSAAALLGEELLRFDRDIKSLSSRQDALALGLRLTGQGSFYSKTMGFEIIRSDGNEFILNFYLKQEYAAASPDLSASAGITAGVPQTTSISCGVSVKAQAGIFVGDVSFNGRGTPQRAAIGVGIGRPRVSVSGKCGGAIAVEVGRLKVGESQTNPKLLNHLY